MKIQTIIISLSIILLLSLCFVSSAGAGEIIKPIKCFNQTVDSSEAVEEITITKTIPVTESKVVRDSQAISLAINLYLTQRIAQLQQINSLRQNGTKIDWNKIIPIKKPDIKSLTKTIQVPIYKNVTKYRFVKTFPFVQQYTIRVPITEQQEVTENHIKGGYYLNQETGEFYKVVCSGGGI